ncbi:hypothetical protein [Neobacillus sp. Marseille-QA0830]
MSSWSKDQQVCASCIYWAGRREVDFTGFHFYALDPTGTCQKPFGPFRSHPMGEGSYCPEWETFDEDNG